MISFQENKRAFSTQTNTNTIEWIEEKGKLQTEQRNQSQVALSSNSFKLRDCRVFLFFSSNIDWGAEKKNERTLNDTMKNGH